MNRGWRGALRLLARPVRRDRGLKGIVIQPYRGYGTSEEVFLMGRVFRQPRFGARLAEGSLVGDTVDVARRAVRWGLGGATIHARCHDAATYVVTDSDGYFEVRLRFDSPPPTDELWHHVDLRLQAKGEVEVERGEVFIPPATARFVVISDIDDTVMLTGVVNKARMIWNLFFQEAESRTAFPGVAAFYRALHHGKAGDEKNPMLYVSRAPWSIYEVLERFFNLHRIPTGPVLFLREWGLTLQRPLPRRARGHKRDLIESMLRRYDQLPFILVGDSGQRDPEVYAEVVRDFPGRVLAVYIRNVTKGGSRDEEITRLAQEVERAGSPLVLAGDTFPMAKHAAEMGFISEADLEEVLAEREEEMEDAPPRDPENDPPVVMGASGADRRATVD